MAPPVPVIAASIRIPFITSVVKVLLDKLIPPVVINKESDVPVPLDLMVELVASAMGPTMVLIPLGLEIAPKLLIPVPLIVRDSGILNPFPFIFKFICFSFPYTTNIS